MKLDLTSVINVLGYGAGERKRVATEAKSANQGAPQISLAPVGGGKGLGNAPPPPCLRVSAGKVEASIPVKISSCSYLETRFPPIKKIYSESKIEKKHKTYLFKILLYEIEYFC
jgi:hypothetical protein